jgi:hypothetical protein
MWNRRYALTLVVSLVATASVAAQLNVIERGKPMVLRGEVVEISCYQAKGIEAGTGAAHVACAKECAAKGRSLGLLTEGDGLFRLVGGMTANNNAKLVPFLGQTVDLSGTQVLLSNTYDIRQNFDATAVTVAKK